MVRMFEIYSVSNFQLYDTVLFTISIRLGVRSPELIYLIAGSLCPLSNISCLSVTPQLLQLPFQSVSMSLAFLDSIYKWDHSVFVFLWVISQILPLDWYPESSFQNYYLENSVKPTLKSIQDTNSLWLWASLVVQTVKNLPAKQNNSRFYPWVSRSPGEGNGYPL